MKRSQRQAGCTRGITRWSAAGMLALAMAGWTSVRAAPYPGPTAPSTETIIEAENFDTGGQGVAYNDTTLGDNTLYRAGDVDISNTSPGPSGFHVTTMAVGEWLEYTVDVPQTCNYRIGLRCKTPTAGVQVQVTIGAYDSGPISLAANANFVHKTIANPAALTAGVQTMRVTVVANPATLDFDYTQFVMLNGTAQAFPSVHAIPGIIEAENFDMGGPTISYVDSNLWSAGQRYRSADVDVYSEAAQPAGTYVVGSIVNTTEYLTYSVNVAEEAWYEIEYRYGVKNDTTLSHQFRILMDGTDVTGTLTVPRNAQGNWGTNYTVNRYGTEFVVTNQKLTAGAHIMKVEWLNVANNVNLDSFKFTKYAAEPQTQDIGFWRFDLEGREDAETAGTIKDLSVNANDGTAYGSPQYDNEIPAVRPGQTGKTSPNHTVQGGYLNRMSLSLIRGSSQYVAVPHKAVLSLGESDFTIGAWVSSFTPPSTGDASTRQWVVQKKVAGASEDATDYALLAGGADLANGATWGNTTAIDGTEVVMLFGTGSGVETAVSTLKVPVDAKWHWVQASYSAAKKEVVFLVDGQLNVVTGVNRSAVSTNSGPLFIGGGGTPGQYLDGWLDEVRISPFALPGTPTGAGSLGPQKKWFWNNEGTGSFNGMMAYTNNGFAGVVTNYQPMAMYNSRLYESLKSNYQIVPVAGDPGNYAIRLHDHDEIDDAWLYWDDKSRAIAGKELCTPQDLTNGATFQMRFKINDFRDNARQGTEKVKFCRLICYLKDVLTANAKFQWEMYYADATAKTGVSLFSGFDIAPSYRWQSANLMDGAWHTLHATAYKVDSGKIHQMTWLDGTLVEDFDRTTEDLVMDPVLGFNDHYHPHQWLTEADFDYVRISGTGAWGPDGTVYNCPSSPDLDGNLSVDGSDYGLFAGCFNGTGNPISPGCESADLNCDGSVDGADYGLFAGCFNGTGNPSPCPL